jgi:hypothetical protein
MSGVVFQIQEIVVRVPDMIHNLWASFSAEHNIL